MLKPHIVILGAGFGGVYLAQRLVSQVKAGEIDVTIVNRTNYFLFTPLLHEVATGSLSATSVAEPLREVFAHSGIHSIQADIISIKSTAKMVVTSIGSIEYDYLVIATGAETNYYGIPGAEKFTLPLKNLSDADRIRARIINTFECAVREGNTTDRLSTLSYAVVGGGATGVETAAELAEFVYSVVARYYHDTNCKPGDPGSCAPEEPTVTLVHTGTELLQQFDPILRRAAAQRLIDIGVKLQFGSAVTSVTRDGLMLANNTTIPARTIIWAAGVKAHIPHFDDMEPTLFAGRLAVNEFFQITGNERIFACGDVAGYRADPDPTKPPLPMLAQVATRQADTIAYNIHASINEKTLHSFTYHSKGSMVSVGTWFAIGQVMSLRLSGKFTWWMWRTIYLFKFASWKKRFRIMFEWTIGAFYTRDITTFE